jgi:hypothetical protein
MGKYVFDQYTILHIASGVVAYFWGVSLKLYFIIHVIFEYLENIDIGIHIINNYFTFWPGGKDGADTIVNSVSDIIFGCLGWYISFYLDNYYKNKKVTI